VAGRSFLESLVVCLFSAVPWLFELEGITSSSPFSLASSDISGISGVVSFFSSFPADFCG